MRVVVEPALLVQGFASPGSDAARLLTVLEFGAAAAAVHEAQDLQGRLFGPVDPAADIGQALARWEPLDQRLPPQVTDDVELVISEPLLLEVQELVGRQPALGLDAEQVCDQLVRRHVCKIAPLEDLQSLRSEMAEADSVASDLAEVALVAGAGCVVCRLVPPMFTTRSRSERPRRTVHWYPGQRVVFGKKRTVVHTLQTFRDEVLPFPLHLVDDPARA